MANARMRFLGRDDIERIHSTALKTLEEVGVLVHSEEVNSLLLEAGAGKSRDGSRTIIPEDLVKDALASAPKTILLASADGDHDITIPSGDGTLYVANGGEGVRMVDLITGETRPSQSSDLRNFAKLIDALPQVDFYWSMVGALEEPPATKEVVEMKISMEWTSKHIQMGAITASQARKMIQMAAVLTNGPDNLAKRPIISAVQCPISPLAFEKGLVEAQVEFSRGGIPVIAMAATVAGLTSPITIAGTIAQITAENLASLVISQAARKGAPFVFSCDSSPGDLKTGSIDYGALENPLIRTAAGEIGEYLGLPKMVAGVGLENLSSTLGNLWEGVAYVATQSLVPSDLGSGLGGLDQAVGASYEQLVLDAWVWEIAREFRREFDTSDDAISYETIASAGVDGNFLGKKHTAMRFKSEFTSTRMPETTMSVRLKAAERGEAIARAHVEAKRILGEQWKPKISPEQSARMDAIVYGR
ncbi:MAG: trimethylamine methyltransferase family protein [Thermoplasmata archaeon]